MEILHLFIPGQMCNSKPKASNAGAIIASILGLILASILFIAIETSIKVSLDWFKHDTFTLLWRPLSVAVIIGVAILGWKGGYKFGTLYCLYLFLSVIGAAIGFYLSFLLINLLSLRIWFIIYEPLPQYIKSVYSMSAFGTLWLAVSVTAIALGTLIGFNLIHTLCMRRMCIRYQI